MKIEDIENGMRNVNIEGKIANMNHFMLVVDDGSGTAFVRYRNRNLENRLERGNHVKIRGCMAVEYSGILQLKMNTRGQITNHPRAR